VGFLCPEQSLSISGGCLPLVHPTLGEKPRSICESWASGRWVSDRKRGEPNRSVCAQMCSMNEEGRLPGKRVCFLPCKHLKLPQRALEAWEPLHAPGAALKKEKKKIKLSSNPEASLSLRVDLKLSGLHQLASLCGAVSSRSDLIPLAFSKGCSSSPWLRDGIVDLQCTYFTYYGNFKRIMIHVYTNESSRKRDR
uniref:Erythropoietin n=1 Tax=Sus scrofa TaxID=9823 RepID=A0A8D0TBY8_PIG